MDISDTTINRRDARQRARKVAENADIVPPASHNHTLRAFEDAHGLALTTSDRVAGLLLLLYAQRIASIAKLTAGHVRDNGDQVQIMLGTAPVVLPDPLAGLVRELVATRRGHAAIGHPGTTPWLFPGGRPGQPIGDDRLGIRLRNIGLHPPQPGTG